MSNANQRFEHTLQHFLPADGNILLMQLKFITTILQTQQ